MDSDLLHDLGFFGRYLHMHVGGRGGKQSVLARLHRNNGRLTQRELLECTCISPAALSEVLTKLEAEGLVAREPYERDRRQLLIELTPKGLECATRMRRQRDEFEAKAFSCLAPEEKDQLRGLVSRLVEHWNKLEESEVSA